MRQLTLVFGLLILLGIAACQDADSPAGPSSPAFDLQEASSGKVVTIDDRLAALDAPGFAGLYYDESGQLVVRSVDPNIDRSMLTDRLNQFQAEARISLAADFRIESADYTFADLVRWRRQVFDLLNLPEVHSLDVDEVANRVAVGLVPGADRVGVAQEVERLGVPAAAVVLQDLEPSSLNQTIRQKVRDTVGGLMIENKYHACTMGFNAFWGADRVFITASHCTNGQGGVQGDKYYQPYCDPPECNNMRGPSVPPGNVVGVELADPEWTMWCDGELFCRYSDSAIIDYYRGVGSDLGEIARTTGVGSLTISTTTPRWHIIGEQALLVNQNAHHVGAMKGYRYGPVTKTCEHVTIDDHKYLCSIRYTAISDGGDSGAPVFRVVSSSNVKLVGVLYGGNATTTLASSISSIRQELETPLKSLTTY